MLYCIICMYYQLAHVLHFYKIKKYYKVTTYISNYLWICAAVFIDCLPSVNLFFETLQNFETSWRKPFILDRIVVLLLLLSWLCCPLGCPPVRLFVRQHFEGNSKTSLTMCMVNILSIAISSISNKKTNDFMLGSIGILQFFDNNSKTLEYFAWHFDDLFRFIEICFLLFHTFLILHWMKIVNFSHLHFK